VAHNSKFLELLESNRAFLTEDKFVKGSEKSELPPVGDFEEPEDVPVDQEQPDVPDVPDVPDGGEDGGGLLWTSNEKNLLELAMKIYISYEDSPDIKFELDDLWKSGKYEDIQSRLSQLDRVNEIPG
jgi:hypothetical protein